MTHKNQGKSRVHIWVGVLVCLLIIPLWVWEYNAEAQPTLGGETPPFTPVSGHLHFTQDGEVVV